MMGYISLALCFLSLTVRASDTLWLPLKGNNIGLVSKGDKQSEVLLYNMHDNENTSAVAGRIIALKYGGAYYELVHNGKRLISIPFGKDSIHFDPNRIYTDKGISLQLKRNKVRDTIRAHQLIAVWRDTLLSKLDIRNRSLVIALHNNTNQEYSVKSYMPGGEYENEAHAICKGIVRDKDDFYFVTDPDIMNRLSYGRYHIVLQANDAMTDDGSLSVYCARLGIPYVNVEAQHGHLFRQLKMLIYAFQRLVPDH